MSPAQLLELFDRGEPVPGATIFRFRRLVSTLNATGLALVGLAILALLAVIWPGLSRPLSGGAYAMISIGGLMAASGFWAALNGFRALSTAASNVLIVTSSGVVLRLRNHVHFWGFAEYPSVTVVRRTRRTVGSVTFDVGDLGPAPLADGMADRPSATDSAVTGIYLNRAGGRFENSVVQDGSFGPPGDIFAALLSARSTHLHDGGLRSL